MKVEFVGLGDTHGYVHEESTNLKKLAKQITDETGVTTDIRAGSGKGNDELIVAGNIVPVGGAVVIKNGSASTLSADAFNSQYREVIDFDTEALDKKIDKLEKRVGEVEAFKKAYQDQEDRLAASTLAPKAGKLKAVAEDEAPKDEAPKGEGEK